MCLNVIQNMIILIFLYSVYQDEHEAPIIVQAVTRFVSPLPQAIMLTAIVIGVCFNALAVIFIVKLYYKYRTLNVSELFEH